MFNEFYARDTSRKIRAVNKAKGERGVPLITHISYGYAKDPEDKKHWLVDPKAAAVVRRIFRMCMEGRGPTQIAGLLMADKVLNPTAYKQRQWLNTPANAPENPYFWNTSTVVHILERREYTGCTVNFRTYTNSIWDKKQRVNAVESRVIFPGTHEAIIEEDVFERVQEIREQRHRKTRTGISSPFSGLVFCADCGAKMRFCLSNNGKYDQAFFQCSTHTKRRGKCGSHFIRASVLEHVVFQHMKLVMGYILCHEAHFRAVMEEQLLIESREKIRVRRKQLDRDEKRISELKRLFVKIYEGNAARRLNDERFGLLSQNYEAEQKQLEAETATLQQEIAAQEQQNESVEKFIQTADKYVDLERLDAYALHELVQAIYMDAPDKSSGHRVQHIHIKYNGLGFIPLEKLMQKETA